MPQHRPDPEKRLPALPGRSNNFLSRPEFQKLAQVPAELEWWANIDNPRTKRAYAIDVREFMDFAGIRSPAEMRDVRRAHVIAWRKDLERRPITGSTIRRKLAALSFLFEYLCEKNAVETNPVKGVKRPRVETYEGKTPALGDHQARKLLLAPSADTLKGKRDRAILSVLPYHALRRIELCKLKVKDIQERRSVKHLRVHGKGGKVRFVPAHPGTLGLISDYLEAAGHGDEPDGALFRPTKNNLTKRRDASLSPNAIYAKVVQHCAKQIGLAGSRIGPHALRATAATNALDHQADIAKVQEWLGDTNIATTRIYDRRRMRPEDSPTFKVAY